MKNPQGFIECIEELMDQGHQVAIPCNNEEFDEIRENMRKIKDSYYEDSTHK